MATRSRTPYGTAGNPVATNSAIPQTMVPLLAFNKALRDNPNIGIVNGRVSVGAFWWEDDASWSDFWNGRLDEVRISRIPRRDCWLEAGYNNQSDARAFLSIGGIQPSRL